MRYLIFAPEQHEPLAEGIQKSAYASVQALREAGHVCDVVSQISYGQARADYPLFFKLSSDTNRLVKYCAWIAQGFQLRRLCRKNRHDRVIVFSLDLSFIAPLLILRRTLPAVSFTIAIFGARECKGTGSLMLRTLKKSNMHFWCAAPRIAALLGEHGIKDQHIICQPVFFTRQFIEQSFIKEGTAERNPNAIAYLSSADPRAGLDTMIDLARALPNKHIIIAIRKFGKREETTILQKISEIESFRLSNITIMRTIPDMGHFLRSISTVILPPENEDSTMAVPLVALEAAFVSTRVLMTDLPVFSELFSHGIAEPFSDNSSLLGKLSSAPPKTPRPLQDYAVSVSRFLEMI